jgi:hypothetical protein
MNLEASPISNEYIRNIESKTQEFIAAVIAGNRQQAEHCVAHCNQYYGVHIPFLAAVSEEIFEEFKVLITDEHSSAPEIPEPDDDGTDVTDRDLPEFADADVTGDFESM